MGLSYVNSNGIPAPRVFARLNMQRSDGNSMACKTRPPACENSTVGSWVKSDFSNLKKIRKIVLVGAPRFELGTSCAQASGAMSWKSFLFNLVLANKRDRRIFGSGEMYRNVAPHAQSPPNFPLSEETAKFVRRLLAVE
jgi:hypothetical protein